MHTLRFAYHHRKIRYHFIKKKLFLQPGKVYCFYKIDKCLFCINISLPFLQIHDIIFVRELYIEEHRMDTNEFQELVLKGLKSNSAYPKE